MTVADGREVVLWSDEDLSLKSQRSLPSVHSPRGGTGFLRNLTRRGQAPQRLGLDCPIVIAPTACVHGKGVSLSS